MNRTLIALLFVAGVAAFCLPLQAACRVHRAGNVRHHHVETKIAVPFAIPVAVPVAVVSPYLYSYSQYQDRESRIEKRRPEIFSPLAPRYSPLVATHCAACHSGASPIGKLSLESIDTLSLRDRLAAIRAVLSRRMPKGTKLDDEQLHGIVEELTAE